MPNHYDPSKHHRRSIRLPGFDYASEGAYAIAIVTKNRRRILSQIKNGTAHLSKVGLVLEQEWLRTPALRPNIELGAYAIMPDHFHGIILAHPLFDEDEQIQHGTFQSPTKNSIGAIIRGFKSAVSRRLKEELGIQDSIWHRNYYEHIIRDEQDYNAQSNYILNNPRNWKG